MRTAAPELPRTRIAPRHAGLLRRFVARLSRQRTRHALAKLDHRLLDDVGLTPERARIEAATPFWR